MGSKPLRTASMAASLLFSKRLSSTTVWAERTLVGRSPFVANLAARVTTACTAARSPAERRVWSKAAR